MKLSQAELVQIAHLSRLEFDLEQQETMGKSLSEVLTYMEELNSLNTDNIQPTVHAVELFNVLREDDPSGSLDKELTLLNAPDRENGYFKVPKVI